MRPHPGIPVFVLLAALAWAGPAGAQSQRERAAALGAKVDRFLVECDAAGHVTRLEFCNLAPRKPQRDPTVATTQPAHPDKPGGME